MNINEILSNKDLFEIGIRNKTDKTHSGGAINSYLRVMEFYFKHLRDEEIKILEIGVRTGNSVKTWKEYFTKAKIYGIDIDDCTKYTDDRIKIFQGDQKDIKVLNTVSQEVDYFDIIIDDGSHVNTDIKESYNFLINKLRPKGIYIIEDLSNSYPYRTCGENKIHGNERKTLQVLFDSIVFSMDKSTWTGNNEFVGLHFWPGMCVIIKN
jgi:hypothetical protein